MSNHNDKNELNSGKLPPSDVEDNPEPSQECKICKEVKPLYSFHKAKTNKLGHDYRCKVCKKREAVVRRGNNYFMEYTRTKRSECKRKGIPFNLTYTYLETLWTGICPIFNCKINYNHKGKGSHHLNQAHLDRIEPHKGYTIGNVCWISGRANRIKYDATVEEIENILDYLKGATTIPKGSTPK